MTQPIPGFTSAAPLSRVWTVMSSSAWTAPVMQDMSVMTLRNVDFI
jgi:hypothetical protein